MFLSILVVVVVVVVVVEKGGYEVNDIRSPLPPFIPPLPTAKEREAVVFQ